MDPYKVLGVARTASDEEIKKTYRELARKYHPDNYVNNPLADLAQEKMKEINEAYEMIQKERAGGGSSGSSYSSGSSGAYGGYNSYAGRGYNTGYQSYQSSSSPEFVTVRQYINSNNLDAAEQALSRSNNRNGEWHFLMGSICVRRGWYDEARRYLTTACQMDPANREYRMALQNLNMQGSYYNTRSAPASQPDFCSCCSNLLLADCCCECMGGDLVPCI